MMGGIGQFGFQHTHALDYFEVSPTEFRPLSDASVAFQLSGPREGLNFAATNRFSKSIAMRPLKGAPTRIVYESGSTGFSIEYRDGFTWDVSDSSLPFITWSEGSVGPGISTPQTKWVLLTWKEARQPLLLCFSVPVSLKVEENGNFYRVKSEKLYSGIVRVRAPFGLRRFATNSANDLGNISRNLQASISDCETAAPKVTGFDSQGDNNGLVANWKYDKAGALIPIPLEYAVKNGLATLISQTKAAPNLEGRRRTITSLLSVRFNCRKASRGIAVCIGSPLKGDAAATVAPTDAESVCDATMSTLFGNGDSILKDELNSAQSDFYGSSQKTLESVTGLYGWFGRDGSSALLATSYAFLKSVRGDDSELEGLLGTVSWTDWMPIGKSEEERALSAGVLSVAAAFSDDNEWRLLGAMANIGALCKLSKGSYVSLRKEIYYSKVAAPILLKYQPLFSGLRILSGDVFATIESGSLTLSGNSEKGKSVKVVVQSPLKFGLLPPGIKIESSLNVHSIEITPTSDEWKIRIPLISLIGIPKAVPSPRYSANLR